MSIYHPAKALLGLLIAAALAAPLAAHAQKARTPAVTMDTPAASALDKPDQKIVQDMALANMAEVEAGKLALSKTQNAEIRAYAQQMVDDHGKALANVQALALDKGVTLATALDAKRKARAGKLARLSGAAFDRAYMAQAGVADHAAVLAKLEKDIAKASDADVKALASKLQPTVAQHLDHAQKMPVTGGGK